MKAKTLALSAIICGASILGINFSTAYAATKINTATIEQNIQTQELSQKVRDRNRAIGAVVGVAAVANKNKHHDHYREPYRPNDRHGRHYPPPPPPRPHR